MSSHQGGSRKAGRGPAAFLPWVLWSLLILPLAQAQDIHQVTPDGVDAILAAPLQPAPLSRGQADVTVVEYFDYQCPECRRMEPALRELLASDAHVRLVYKDWPIFGATSVYAAYCTLAAAQLGQYEAARQALMKSPGGFESRADVERRLREAGLDVTAITAYIRAHQMELSATLTRNHTEAGRLGLKGTPGLLIGDQLITGGLGLPQMRQLVAQARKAKLVHIGWTPRSRLP